MIGWLSGTVRDIDTTGAILLNINGVGYDVSVSLQTLCNLQLGESASLYIHSYVREDQFTLFGFTDQNERSMFRKLNKVSGIGARTALSLMSGMSTTELAHAIEQADDLAIARTPGIGKKTAMRLILELQGKLDMDLDSNTGTQKSNHALNDLRSALLNLGYKPIQVDKALKAADTSQGFEHGFKTALKALS
ncbi:MAG: Holliday junction branch migration protein RuvA [Mariprofundaceae bacterium]